MDAKNLFLKLYKAKDEEDVDRVIEEYAFLFNDPDNWKPLGDTLSNFSIVKNQQSNPIAAVIEKITNSIDAILMKKCYEQGIKPTSSEAPETMEKAIDQFFPNRNWDLTKFRRGQAENIQVVADGKGPYPKRNSYDTSLIVYDNGEGQRPEDFEDTFLSLIKGNKVNIPFVQGKYNMGGTGAIVFCGKKRYQLIASKRYDGGNFGFTLIREHKDIDTKKRKETWFEYFIPNGKILSFNIDQLDLGLYNRKFTTGTILKLYSYQLPAGYYEISLDLNQSINEYLFDPALPLFTIEKEERYPKQKNLENDLYGLSQRLINEESEYIDEKETGEIFRDDLFGKMTVSWYLFKNQIKDWSVKDTKNNIRDRYFKNNMSVLFSMNGQVHGHYTSEFITRSLKMNLLKNHLLIHVDCTEMDYEFRKELFMASRDRLKDGEETQALRSYLADKLGASNGRLAEIEKRRKSAVDIDTSSTTQNLIRNLSESIPKDSELMKLLNQTLKLEAKKDKPKKDGKPKRPKREQEEEPFHPERFPTFFNVQGNGKADQEVAKIPLGGERTIKFETDVEDEYFNRTEEPGDIQFSVLDIRNNDSEGGTDAVPNELTDLFNVHRSSPHKGEIRLNLNPKDTLKVGDAIQIKATLTSPTGDFDELFWVKIKEKDKPKKKAPKKETDFEELGLPQLVFTYQDPEGKEGAVSWDDVLTATNEPMDVETVMVPDAKGDMLEKIYVNMESHVFMNYRSKLKNPNQEQLELAKRKYYTSVYFHTLFLYMITKNRKYKIYQEVEDRNEPEEIDVGSYLKDVFDHYYSDFLLNFQMEQLIESLGE